jgi:hypothetical protein
VKTTRKKKITDIAVSSITMGVSGIAIGSIGSLGNVHVQGIAARGQEGLGLASVGLPVMGARLTLGELKKLGKMKY